MRLHRQVIILILVGIMIIGVMRYVSYRYSNQFSRNPIQNIVTDTDPGIRETPQIIEVTSGTPFLDAQLEKTVPPIVPVSQKPKAVFTCPQPDTKDQADLWLAPVGPDLGVDNYIPKNLTLLRSFVPTSSEKICLNASAATRLESMRTAMKQEGLSFLASSGYRDVDYQAKLRAASEAKRDTIKDPYPYVALPGHSEHQLGVAIDIVAGPNYTLNDFVNTREFAWMREHAWEYGFVQSYPEGSEAITGYAAESWHWRYVGLTHAKNIHDQGITAYEYFKSLAAQEQKNP